MPKPEKHVFICGQSRPPGHPRGSCAEKNGGEVFERFMWLLQGRDDLFGKVQITMSGCIGPCGDGPTVLVYPEGVMYRALTADQVDEVFEKHLIGGEPVEAYKMPAEVWG